MDFTITKPSIHDFSLLLRVKRDTSTWNRTCLSGRQKNPRSVAVKVFSLARFSKKIPRTHSMRHTIAYRNSPCSQRRNHAIMRRTFPATSFPAYLAFFLVPRCRGTISAEFQTRFVRNNGPIRMRHYAHSYSTVLNRISIRNVTRLLTQVCLVTWFDEPRLR